MPGCNRDGLRETPERAVAKDLSGNKTGFVVVDHVSKTFRRIVGVRDVSFNIARGTIFGLVGSDGAGKSTLLRMAAAMIRPSDGAIRINGMDVVSEQARVKKIIGYMPQRFGLYQDLTVSENFDFFMDIFGISGSDRRQRRERYLGFSNLLPFAGRPAGDLSGGMKQKLGLACVLVHEPQLLILDEPTNGVDPVSRGEFWEILAEMKRQGMTILVSTAYLDEGEKCDCLGLMHRNRLVDVANPDQLRSYHPSLEDAMIHRIQEVDEALIHDSFKF